MKPRKLKQISIFDSAFSQEVLTLAKLTDVKGCVHNESITEEKGRERKTKPRSEDLRNFRCSLCNIFFRDLDQQRAHFKSEWHAFNIKMKISGKVAIDEFIFHEKCENEVENDGIHISLEEDYDDDDIELGEKKPKVEFVTNDKQSFTIYRCLLEKDSKENCTNCSHFEEALKVLCNDNYWIVLMMSAGHFAAGIYHKEEIIAHKTIHRYVVRAKRGTVQSKRDGKQSGKSPRSAGAHIRRQNEIALIEEIQELLCKWKEQIDHADRIFIKWPQSCKSIIFGGKNPILDKHDTRVRKIPFQTNKPTYEELHRIYLELSTFSLKDLSISTSQGQPKDEFLQITETVVTGDSESVSSNF
ncbi:tRNA endonuclease ANKZF1-like [Rhopilema esculentum]|uniref:tRNA endonuclease ANKZF1-like n=1 Tax=Rhopilema esculentum TaxID=499914 RepID=UPI0031DDD57C